MPGGLAPHAGAEAVIPKVSPLQLFEREPPFCEVGPDMKSQGLFPYDLRGLQFRLNDGPVALFNITFVKEEKLFRRSHCYVTPEQQRQETLQSRTYFLESLSK